MADKTGSDSLVLSLERIALEHYAMKCLLRKENPSSWRRDVLGFYRENARDKEIRARFDELYGELRSNPVDTRLTEILVAVLEQTNLDGPLAETSDDLSWR